MDAADSDAVGVVAVGAAVVAVAVVGAVAVAEGIVVEASAAVEVCSDWHAVEEQQSLQLYP